MIASTYLKEPIRLDEDVTLLMINYLKEIEPYNKLKEKIIQSTLNISYQGYRCSTIYDMSPVYPKEIQIQLANIDKVIEMIELKYFKTVKEL